MVKQIPNVGQLIRTKDYVSGYENADQHDICNRLAVVKQVTQLDANTAEDIEVEHIVRATLLHSGRLITLFDIEYDPADEEHADAGG